MLEGVPGYAIQDVHLHKHINTRGDMKHSCIVFLCTHILCSLWEGFGYPVLDLGGGGILQVLFIYLLESSGSFYIKLELYRRVFAIFIYIVNLVKT